ncbi:MAG: MoxR family ATPase [Mariniblastus sp.]|nr:MoxR family ATPase [Mariniblastus sp.]
MIQQNENKGLASAAALQSTEEFKSSIQSLRSRLNTALVGKSDVIEMVIACVLARGHLLFDDLPGLGKTTLAKALAASLGGDFSRVQCTPDLLPTDISGFNVFNQKTQEFEFRRGPVFSDLLLADEINRATPRTQSALFEAMAERQVTIDNNTMPLASTFLVIATQNPIESHGAYPLPEAQLDRFAIKLSIGYPARSDEIEMLGDNIGSSVKADEQHAVISLSELSQIQAAVQSVEVTESVRGYFVDLATATRQHSDIEIGLSPRGVIIWQRMAQAWAYLQDRKFVIPDDIKTVAKPVLQLRIASNSSNNDSTIDEIINSVNVPGM